MLKKIVKKIFRNILVSISGIFWYLKDLFAYRRLLKKLRQKTALRFFPQIFDRDPASHTFDKHYVYMDQWAFKHILSRRPAGHVDVGSSVRFLSMATTVSKIKFVDIRPLALDFENFECAEGSILHLPFADNSIASLSCLHVAEHIGLGRYGDPLDPEGTQEACKELARVLAPGGSLYFALPVGRPITYFNAHRVHNPQTVLEYFKDLKLVSFAAVGDDGYFYPAADPKDFSNAAYACGCFEFTK